MVVKDPGEIYECEVCGNKVGVVKVGGGTLACCKQNMRKTDEKPWNTEASPVNMPDSDD
jgi:desulfoferrodoxin-like iron-binding protein